MSRNLVWKQIRNSYRVNGNSHFQYKYTYNQECMRTLRHLLYFEKDVSNAVVASSFLQNFGFMMGYDSYKTCSELLKLYGFKPCVYVPIYLQPYARLLMSQRVPLYNLHIRDDEKENKRIWDLLNQYENKEYELHDKLCKLSYNPYGQMALKIAWIHYMAEEKLAFEPMTKHEYKLISKAMEDNLE